MMTRKDYIEVARIIAENETDDSREMPDDEDDREEMRELNRANVIDAFAEYFQRDNPQFDPRRFRAACDPQPAGRKAAR